jgi:hypothetical protein
LQIEARSSSSAELCYYNAVTQEMAFTAPTTASSGLPVVIIPQKELQNVSGIKKYC